MNNYNNHVFTFSKNLLTDPILAMDYADELQDRLERGLSKGCDAEELDALSWYRAIQYVHSPDRLN